MLPFMIASGQTHGFFESVVGFVAPEIIGILELIGITIISIGSIKAFYLYIRSLIRNEDCHIKVLLGNSLALALEFKMGAEILKTLTIRTLNEIYVLGAIIILRALLSFLIHFEVKSEKEHNETNIKEYEH